MQTGFLYFVSFSSDARRWSTRNPISTLNKCESVHPGRVKIVIYVVDETLWEVALPYRYTHRVIYCSDWKLFDLRLFTRGKETRHDILLNDIAADRKYQERHFSRVPLRFFCRKRCLLPLLRTVLLKSLSVVVSSQFLFAIISCHGRGPPTSNIQQMLYLLATLALWWVNRFYT